MWWCCGKQSRDAPGCKFSKHESKDDEDEDKEKDETEKIREKRQKCMVIQLFELNNIVLS